MKKIVILLLMLTNLCVAQNNKKNTTMKYDKKNRPELNDSFEKLNLDFYIKDGMTITKKKSRYNDPDELAYDEYNYTKEDSLGKTTLYGSWVPSERVGGFRYNYQYKNSIYRIGKQYYKDGSIKSKCIVGGMENQSFILGKEYLFHANGTFNKVIDHDLGWDFSLEDVLNYVESREQTVESENNAPQLGGIEKRKSKTIENLNYWEVVFSLGEIDNRYHVEYLKMDAKTGEILSQERYGEIYGDIKDPGESILLKTIVADKTEVITQKKKSKKQEGYVSNDDDNDNNNLNGMISILILILTLAIMVGGLIYISQRSQIYTR